jgi:hypothetical protein
MEVCVYWLLGLVVFMGIFLLIARVLVRRFEAEQIARGRWDEDGPLIETRGPSTTSGKESMAWMMEIKGLVKPVVVYDRRRQKKKANTRNEKSRRPDGPASRDESPQ